MGRAAKLLLVGAWAAGVCSTNAIAAQPYPVRPVRIVLPLSPGGGVDAVGRLIAQELAGALNQSVVVEHRPGAAGNIAAQLVAKATPDGHTLLLVAANHAINPSLYKDLGYDPIKDFAPITKLSVQPYVFVVAAQVPARGVKEFIAFARSRQGGVTYASVGAGLLSHLSMELLRSMAKFEAVHVPYKGAAPAIVDMIGGRVDAFFPTITSSLPHIKANKLRPIAVTSARRVALLPEVGTVAEQGFPGYEVISWYALLAPAGTPSNVIGLLNTQLVKILKSPEVQARMGATGAEPEGSTPKELQAYIAREASRWAKVIKEAGITAQ